MKRTQIRTLLLVVLLGYSLTACGNQADLPTKPVASQTTVVDVMAASSVSKEAHAGGYGNPNIVFFFVLAYLAAPVVL
ncbi:MAG: hypothetical protein OEU36_25115 [Gammaproteobacteria bacterium]|nr:hypothetical protein [Gammaproteobacteria bacterium]